MQLLPPGFRYVGAALFCNVILVFMDPDLLREIILRRPHSDLLRYLHPMSRIWFPPISQEMHLNWSRRGLTIYYCLTIGSHPNQYCYYLCLDMHTELDGHQFSLFIVLLLFVDLFEELGEIRGDICLCCKQLIYVLSLVLSEYVHCYPAVNLVLIICLIFVSGLLPIFTMINNNNLGWFILKSSRKKYV